MQLSSSPEETIKWAAEFGKGLLENSVVCFEGDLGAGKTTSIKGIVAGVTGLSPDEVTSPTFVTLNIYKGKKGKLTVYHFDLYRMHDVDEFLSMGYDEYFNAGGICCIEWPNRAESIIPERAITLHLTHEGETKRGIEVR